MAKQKPGMMIYWDMFDMLDSVKEGKLKTLLRAIRNFSQYGEIPDFGGDEALELVWPMIKYKITADDARYEEIREKRVEAGRKGGIASASKRNQNIANEANASFE